MNEAVYALILMRRHIWLYAEFQATFISAVEQKQAVESLLRTILTFDYIMYFVTQKYEELLKSELAAERVMKKKGDYVINWPGWSSLWGEGRVAKKDEMQSSQNGHAR